MVSFFCEKDEIHTSNSSSYLLKELLQEDVLNFEILKKHLLFNLAEIEDI